MDDDELDIPKGSLLKQLTSEDLEIHSVEALKNRMNVLNAEIKRTEDEINNKKSAHSEADSLFR